MATTLTTSYKKLGEASTGTYSRLRLYGKYNSQNTEKNQTSISLQLRIVGVSGGYGTIGNGTARINSSSSTVNTSFDSSKEVTLKTLTYTVTHDGQGKYENKEVTGYFSASGYTTANISANITLPKIPRASTISVTNGKIGNNVTITIDRKYSAYTDTITWETKSHSGTIASGTSDTIFNFTLPTYLYEEIPDKQQLEITWTVTTSLIKDSSATFIGSNTAKSIASVDLENDKPDFTYTLKETRQSIVDKRGEELTKIFYNLSQPNILVNPTFKNGSSLKNCLIAISDGQTYNGLENLFTQIYGNTITITLTDSRDLSTTQTITLPFEEYLAPSVSTLSLKRLNPTSSFINANITGNFSYDFSIDGVTGNRLTVAYRYKSTTSEEETWSNLYDIKASDITYNEEENTYSINATLDNATCDYRQSYIFEVYAYDSYTGQGTPRTATVTKGIPVFNYGEHNFNFNVDTLTLCDSDGNDRINIREELENLRTTEWADIPLASGISVGSQGGTPQYRKQGKHVFIRGGYAGTKASGELVLGTLPEGFRPTHAQVYDFNSMAGTRVARTFIRTNGQIVFEWAWTLQANPSAWTGSFTWLDVEMDFWID